MSAGRRSAGDVHCAGAPLRECVAAAVDGYFDALEGHECRGLFKLVMKEVEAPLLQSVLRRAGGNQTKAAAILGINRATLRKKLREHHLD